MSDELHLERPVEEPPPLLRPKRRRWPLVLLLLVIVALVGAGGVYAWANIGTLVQSFAREAPGGGIPATRLPFPTFSRPSRRPARTWRS
jgi:hypothetical protein